MEAEQFIFLLALTYSVYQADGQTTYGDMFSHKHEVSDHFHIPSIPGWDPDTNHWDDYLYPPTNPNPKPNDHVYGIGKPKVQLTSDSPALNGSSITFTAKLGYPQCQKVDPNGYVVWDQHCMDGHGQVNSGYVYNWTAWLDDYGFGKCTDTTKCNVFPDGKPFPLSSDWRRKSYVYVWHTMGQYYETCDGSSSSVTINTTNMPLGAEIMEVMVYRKHEHRQYTPLTTDATVFYVTDKIPVAVTIFQKAAPKQPENVFYRGEAVLFSVQLHDPSGYLSAAASVDYLWDFSDGNRLVTHRPVAAHTFGAPGDVSVKLVVEAAFPQECPPPTATTAGTPTPGSTARPPPTETRAATSTTPAATVKAETTHGPASTTATARPFSSSVSVATASGLPVTESLPPAVASVTPEANVTTMARLRSRRFAGNQCFRYVYGTFTNNITIIEAKLPLNSQQSNRIVDVSAARESSTDVTFLVKCLGSAPTSACTIVSDPNCTEVSSIMCDDVSPSTQCEVRLRRTFPEPGVYCVNITLEDPGSLALASTTVTIKSQDTASKSPNTAVVALFSSAVLVVVFAFVGYLVYRRYRVYRPIRGTLVEDAVSQARTRGPMVRLRQALFPASEESCHLLIETRPL